MNVLVEQATTVPEDSKYEIVNIVTELLKHVLYVSLVNINKNVSYRDTVMVLLYTTYLRMQPTAPRRRTTLLERIYSITERLEYIIQL